MTEPTPPTVIVSAIPATPTQVAYPWRSTLRTAFQVLVAICLVWGLVVEAAGLDQTNAVVSATVAFAAGVNRVMALPSVNALLLRFVPWLAAAPALTEAALVDGAYRITDVGNVDGVDHLDDEDHPGGLER